MSTNQVQTAEQPPLAPKAASSTEQPTTKRRITDALLFGSATIQARAGIDRRGSFKNTPAISKELLRLIAISDAEAAGFAFDIKEGCSILLSAVNEELDAVEKKLRHFDMMKGALEKRRLSLVASKERAEECAETALFFYQQIKDGQPADLPKLSIKCARNPAERDRMYSYLLSTH